MTGVRTIRTRGVSATLVRRRRSIDGSGRETFTTIEERAVRAVVASRQFTEADEVRARSSGYLIASDLDGVNESEEDLGLKVGSRTWRIVEFEPEQVRGVRKIWLDYGE